jgi:hypothetical protein
MIQCRSKVGNLTRGSTKTHPDGQIGRPRHVAAEIVLALFADPQLQN